MQKKAIWLITGNKWSSHTATLFKYSNILRLSDKLATRNGASVEWSNGCRYLGIFVTSKHLNVNLMQSKQNVTCHSMLSSTERAFTRLLRFCFHYILLFF